MSSTKKTGILFLVLAVLVALAGSMACQKKAESTATEAEDGLHEYEGTVRAALGRYMYLSTAQGFDICVPGFDAGSLVGQTLKVKGKLLADHPSIFLADSVEKGPGQVLYTRSQEFQTEDFIEMKVREAIPALNISGVNKPEEWENKGQVKIYGKLQKGDVNYIVITDDKDREIAKIIIDSFTTYADYYIQKLKLFDEFWFYLNVKDSVDRRVRTRSKEIFHADVVDVGLF